MIADITTSSANPKAKAESRNKQFPSDPAWAALAPDGSTVVANPAGTVPLQAAGGGRTPASLNFATRAKMVRWSVRATAHQFQRLAQRTRRSFGNWRQRATLDPRLAAQELRPQEH